MDCFKLNINNQDNMPKSSAEKVLADKEAREDAETYKEKFTAIFSVEALRAKLKTGCAL